TLPVPGGIGAVDGGMIGALIGFGVGSSLAVVGVLTYRLLSFWLPVIPGVIAYVQLLRDDPGADEAEPASQPAG
ncbi:MAG TPA: lysylphosphatidylglycerol synthase domain-containing protein, partial [Solirubrobacterales bacterium]|nr:lysylphosphatidylglycerol synthase domain-containing protein [Solirubrobacterales bacterium]